MSANRSPVLQFIFEQIDNIAEYNQSKDADMNPESALKIFELYLQRLQDLNNSLPNVKELHKADVIKLMKSIRKIYTALDVWQDVADVWTKIRSGLNDASVIFKGSELTDSLLISKHMYVLNRNIFAAKRTLRNLDRNQKMN